MSELQNETISISLHNQIMDDLKVQHRYQFDSMKEHYARIFKWLLIVIILLIVIFAGYVFYNAQFETIVYEQDAQYETAVTTSVLNNGTGDVKFNAESASENNGAGQEEQQQEPAENVPDL